MAAGRAPVAVDGVVDVGDGVIGALAVDVGLGRQVPHPPADAAPDAGLDQAVHHLVGEADGARLEERGRTRLEHLHRRELGRQALLLGGVHRAERAQPHEHVLLEGGVVGHVAPGEGLARDVDVGVDQAGRHHEAVAYSIAPAPQPAAAEQAPPGDPSYLIVERDDDGTWIASDVAAAAIGSGATLPEALAMWSEVAEGALRDLRDVHHSEGPPHLTARLEDALSWLEEALDGGVQDE